MLHVAVSMCGNSSAMQPDRGCLCFAAMQHIGIGIAEPDVRVQRRPAANRPGDDGCRFERAIPTPNRAAHSSAMLVGYGALVVGAEVFASEDPTLNSASVMTLSALVRSMLRGLP